jgi:hypothetical protein
MADMPRWLSSSKMETVKALLADDPAMLLRESMGVSADSTTRAFNSADVKALMQRVAVGVGRDILDPSKNTNALVVAVDPSGGGSSAFAVASVVQLPNGALAVTLRVRRAP